LPNKLRARQAKLHIGGETMATSNHQQGSTSGIECRRGAAIGGANGLLWAIVAGGALPIALLAAAGGGAVGALIALLIWSASGELPEDRVLPPRDGC
jgi:hypothetical protein